MIHFFWECEVTQKFIQQVKKFNQEQFPDSYDYDLYNEFF